MAGPDVTNLPIGASQVMSAGNIRKSAGAFSSPASLSTRLCSL